MGFDRNVFINCPFDDEYLPTLRPIIFCTLFLGFEPRIASERLDSGEARLEKILELVRESRFAIHDLSRIAANEAGDIARFNMPFELGLDIGCRRLKGGKWGSKKCLVLEVEPHRYNKALSDMAGSDIAFHHGDPAEATTQVRNWLNNQCNLRADGPARIWGRFNDFMADNYDILTERGYSSKDIENLPISELVEDIQEWLRT